MKTNPTLRPNRRLLDGITPLRFRAELPAVTARPREQRAVTAQHDFLVPNPHPHLTSPALVSHLRETE